MMGILDGTNGLLFVAVLVATFMFGILTLQVYIYTIRYPSDDIRQRLFVHGVWLLDVIHTCLTGALGYHYLVSSFINPLALREAHWTLFIALIVEALITLLVQVFFAARIYRVNRKRKLLFGGTIFLSVTQLIIGSIGGIYALINCKFFEQFDEKLPRLMAGIWCSATVVCDAVIMVGLVTTLHSRKTGFQRSDHMISILIKWGIETGVLTTLFAIADLFLFLFVNNFAHLIFNFALAKLYTNSLMATLNARKQLVKKSGMHDTFPSFINRNHNITPQKPKSPIQSQRVRSGWEGNSLEPENGVSHLGGVGITVTTISHTDPVWDKQKSPSPRLAESDSRTRVEHIQQQLYHLDPQLRHSYPSADTPTVVTTQL